MNPKIWLPCSQEPCIGLYLEPVKSSPLTHVLPMTVTTRCKAWTGFTFPNTEIVGSNPTQGMDVCVYTKFVLSYVGRDLATGWSPFQGVLPTVIGLGNWSKTKRFTDILCSKSGSIRKERERDLHSRVYFNIILSESLSLFSYVFLIGTYS
jgi:hypothetical protein